MNTSASAISGAFVPNIQIDFEVFKQLTIRRRTESMSENDVLRDLLDLPQQQGGANSTKIGEWVTGGVRFPAGTRFRGSLKGVVHEGVVVAGALLMDGHEYNSPSRAAAQIAQYAVNGWLFWECQLPGQSEWQRIESLRN